MNESGTRKIYLREFKAISNAISSYEDINLLGRHLVEGICRSFNVKGCSIFLVDDREKKLFRVSTYGISYEFLREGPIFVNEDAGEFYKGEPVFFDNVQSDPRIQYKEAAAKEGISSILSVPIKFQQTVVGILKLYNDKPWSLHEEDLDSFCVLAKQVGLVIVNNGLKNFLEKVKMAIESLPSRMLEGL